ncbi:MAG TPA: hypothetical protein PKH77_17810 [Anaerolineae bacterium]|nr:hypothetical protein [Anaerolineae bacterium]
MIRTDNSTPIFAKMSPESHGTLFLFDDSAPTVNAIVGWIRSIKGGEGSGFHGHAGRPGQRGGSAAAGTATAPKRITEKVWAGEPEDATPTLNKLQTGAIGEKLVIDLLTESVGVPFGTVNLGVNNAPFDVAGNGFAVEVKTGMATNGKSAMHWRATIGQPGKAEQELLQQMSAEEKRAHNQWKEKKILERKHALLDRMAEEAGKEIKPLTIGIILSADGKRADVYRFDGFHLRLPWNKYATDEYYMGSYETGA